MGLLSSTLVDKLLYDAGYELLFRTIQDIRVNEIICSSYSYDYQGDPFTRFFSPSILIVTI